MHAVRLLVPLWVAIVTSYSSYADRPPMSMRESLAPEEAWERVQRGEARLLDLRTKTERRRYGAPPGAERVSLTRHVVAPEGPEAIYLCQHAVRSKLTGRRGATEVAGGFAAWKRAGLPVEAREDD